MKNIKYLLFIGLLSGLTGCSKEKLKVWNDLNRIWFAAEDTMSIASFKKQPDNLTEFTFEVPVQMAGGAAGQEREIKIEVVKDKRNPQTAYKIEKAFVPADSLRGFLRISVKKTPNLEIVADTVNLVLRASDLFLTGPAPNLNCTLVITNRYSKPWWWYEIWIGEYTEEKHEVLFEVFGNDKDIRGRGSEEDNGWGWDHPDAIYNIWKLNSYCEENDLPFRFE